MRVLVSRESSSGLVAVGLVSRSEPLPEVARVLDEAVAELVVGMLNTVTEDCARDDQVTVDLDDLVDRAELITRSLNRPIDPGP